MTTIMENNKLLFVQPKFNYLTNIFIERCLPEEGFITIKKAAKVDFETLLGSVKISKSMVELPKEAKLLKNTNNLQFVSLNQSSQFEEPSTSLQPLGQSFVKGERIAKLGFAKYFIAPFNGNLFQRSDNIYIFKQTELEFNLLSGVCGTVYDVVDNRSVLIKTNALSITAVFCTPLVAEGLLLVLLNIGEIMKEKSFDTVRKSIFGKVVYAGDFISQTELEYLYSMGAAAVVVGSCTNSSFNYCLQNKLCLLVLAAFGSCKVAEYLHKELVKYQGTMVFAYGNKHSLCISVKKCPVQKKLTSHFKELKKGDTVTILQDPYFGYTGKVTNINNENVSVLVDTVGETALVFYNNLVILN